MLNCFKVTGTFTSTDRGFTITGEIEHGIFHLGDEIQVSRDGNLITSGKIKGIEFLNFGSNQTHRKDNIALLLQDLDDVEILPGDIVCTTGLYSTGR